MKFKLHGGTKYRNKEYTNKDIRGFVPLENMGVNKDFYGGRASCFAKTDDPNIYLVVEETTPIDIAVILRNKASK